jgi:hypothetical protein
MICGSISGLTQYQTAVEAPPHLASLLVREGVFRLPTAARAGIPLLSRQFVAVSWTEHQLEQYAPDRRAKAQALVERWQQEWRDAHASAGPDSPFLPAPDMVKHLPLHPHPLFVDVADYYNDWIVPPAEEGWDAAANLGGQVERVKAPICHLGGWFVPCASAGAEVRPGQEWLDPYTEDNLAREQRNAIRESMRTARPFGGKAAGGAPLLALMKAGLALTAIICIISRRGLRAVRYGGSAVLGGGHGMD